ncbi:hypothetical protein EWM64_g8013 [Hericium alpestre]|uniref:Proteasome activator PA28 C-terminal domain-containing protein n=1 Tax=Hericium alpestre TaxID=135208 RepID=A0A4Y9ZMA7_9AGAM|nr:hypothetical protein EWM64_g8013 [Hericium alpestre]
MTNQPKLDKETSKKIEQFHQNVTTEAEDVIFRVFPSKIFELQELIASTSSPSSPFNLSRAKESTDPTVYPPPTVKSEEPDTKKRKLDSVTANGTRYVELEHARYPNLLVTNKQLTEAQDIVKRECEKLAELCDKVRLWINISMPRVSISRYIANIANERHFASGDNFGVQVQEDVMSELQRSQDSCYNMRDSARQGHLNRAKICSKIIKYPHIEDYAIALKEHDQKHIYFARQSVIEICNIYAVAMDVLHKNMIKLRKPKGDNVAGLY